MSVSSRPMFRGASLLNFLAAVWLVISPLVLAFTQVPSAFWNNILSGIAIAVVAAVQLGVVDQPGWSWANLLLGLWVVISPWALGFSLNGAEDIGFQTALVWNNVITGAIVAFLAVVSLARRRSLSNP